MSRIRVIIGFLGLLVSVVCGQSQADSLFGKANAYYASDKFSEAAELYETLIYSVEHADLYYNLETGSNSRKVCLLWIITGPLNKK